MENTEKLNKPRHMPPSAYDRDLHFLGAFKVLDPGPGLGPSN